MLVTHEGFALPDAAVHDAIADVYLLSNIGGHPQRLADAGFISRIAPDGTVLELRWIDGAAPGITLHAPTGMELVGDVLYVADADAVRLFHRVTGAPLASWPVPVTIVDDRVQGVVLNDVCAGPRGEIYLTQTGVDVSDVWEMTPTGQDAVYRFQDGTPVPIATGAHLMGPNGCVVVGANLFIAPLLSNEVYRLNPSGMRFPVAALPQGGLDGIVAVGGFFYISSLPGSAIYRMSTGGAQVAVVTEEIAFPADLGYDARRQRLLVPSLFGGFFAIQPLR